MSKGSEINGEYKMQIAHTTPIDEFYDDMSKEELYQEYVNEYQMAVMCWHQFDDLYAVLKIELMNQETIKIDHILDLLRKQENERLKLIGNQCREQRGITWEE